MVYIEARVKFITEKKIVSWVSTRCRRQSKFWCTKWKSRCKRWKLCRRWWNESYTPKDTLVDQMRDIFDLWGTGFLLSATRVSPSRTDFSLHVPHAAQFSHCTWHFTQSATQFLLSGTQFTLIRHNEPIPWFNYRLHSVQKFIYTLPNMMFLTQTIIYT